jgi:hypothetical protein
VPMAHSGADVMSWRRWRFRSELHTKGGKEPGFEYALADTV